MRDLFLGLLGIFCMTLCAVFFSMTCCCAFAVIVSLLTFLMCRPELWQGTLNFIVISTLLTFFFGGISYVNLRLAKYLLKDNTERQPIRLPKYLTGATWQVGLGLTVVLFLVGLVWYH